MQIGEVVRYSAYGRTVNALVIAVRHAEPSHAGKNGEPLVSVAFVDPDRESAIEKKQIGHMPKVWTEYDVVHASHEFSAEHKTKLGLTTPAQIAAQRGAGEWSEIEPELVRWVDHEMGEVVDLPAQPQTGPEGLGARIAELRGLTAIEEIRGAVARGWCAPVNSAKIMDTDLAEAISQEVCALLQAPSSDQSAPQE